MREISGELMKFKRDSHNFALIITIGVVSLNSIILIRKKAGRSKIRLFVNPDTTIKNGEEFRKFLQFR